MAAASASAWTDICDESLATWLQEQIFSNYRHENGVEHVQQWAVIFSRVARHLYRIGGQTNYFIIAQAAQNLKAFHDHVVAVTQQMNVSLNKCVTGGMDFNFILQSE